MKDDFQLLAIFFIVLGIVGTVSGALLYFECHGKAKAQGLECEWGFFQGCMVKVDGKWIDYDRLRIMERDHF